MSTKNESTEDRVQEIERKETDKDKKEIGKLLGDILRIGFNLPVKKTEHT